jgi:hypothetical protein
MIELRLRSQSRSDGYTRVSTEEEVEEEEEEEEILPVPNLLRPKPIPKRESKFCK